MHVLITQTNPWTVDGEGEEGKRGNETFPQDLAGLIEISSSCHQTRHAAENVVICTRLAGRSESTSAVVFGCYSFSAIYNSNRSSFYSTFLSYSQAGVRGKRERKVVCIRDRAIPRPPRALSTQCRTNSDYYKLIPSFRSVRRDMETLGVWGRLLAKHTQKGEGNLLTIWERWWCINGAILEVWCKGLSVQWVDHIPMVWNSSRLLMSITYTKSITCFNHFTK